jgi:hypothetical protein
MMKGEANALLLEQIESVKNDDEENDGGGDGDGDGEGEEEEKEKEESYDDNDDNKSMSSSRSNCSSNPNSDSTNSYVPIDERFTGRSYLDIQEDSKQQAAQMYHRFGVRAGDRVLLGKLFL